MENIDNLRVFCRFRPISYKNDKQSIDADDTSSGITFCQFTDDTTVELSMESGLGKRKFMFDRVFSPAAQQTEIYESVAREVVTNVVNGRNGTIMSYGQTGAGKSFSMFGSQEENGIVPRAVDDIFGHIQSSSPDTQWSVRCSLLEIYNQEIRDMLTLNKQDLKIRESPERGIFVENATELILQNKTDIFSAIQISEQSRASQMCAGNISSRAHTIVIIYVNCTNNQTSKRLSGKLCLVDLAGSEKIRPIDEKKLAEAGSILQEYCLTNLGQCLKMRGDEHHIPYRASKLTRLLQNSLNSSTKVALLLVCSQDEVNREETISTCEFGKRVKLGTKERMRNVAKEDKE